MVAITGKQTKRRRRFLLPRACFILSIIALAVMPLWMMFRKQTDDIYETRVGPTRLVPPEYDIPHARFRFLQYYNPLHPLDSDIVELRHCHFQSLDWKKYFTWASHILDEKMPQFRANQDEQYSNVTAMEEEFVLELLEIYATFHGQCRFDTGYPYLPASLPLSTRVFPNVTATHDLKYARLAIVIVAFQDAPQLHRLVEAIHMSHHSIVIQVERRTSRQFLQEAQDIASHYDNVAVVQFGTIIYRTDLVTTTQLQLMKWTSLLQYDYYVALNGAAYPLYSAEELAIHLQSSKRRHVWLGELTNGRDGTRVRTSQAGMLVGAKRLAYTRGNSAKGTFRLSQSLVEQNGVFSMNVSDDIHDAMSCKTVSGNQAVYSYETVQKLLASPQAMQLFAFAKYGCCGVLEERTWIAAMRLLGIGDEALDEPGCMWQVWGGNMETCQSSVQNAILTRNASRCFKVEDATRGIERNGSALYIRGNEITQYLKDAKRRGFLFARKFQSNNKESMSLLNDIQREIHNS